MKKTIIILLLTALCMAVFASCDFSGGLVGELLAELNQQEDILVDPPVDYYESNVILVDPIEPWGTIEVETTPSVEIETWEETIQEYWSEDIGVAYPDVLADLTIHTIEFVHPSVTESTSVNGNALGTQYVVKSDLISVSLVGMAVLYAGECTVGYRISEECIFDENFWGVGTDSIPEYRELRIEIPADQLTDGYNEITLIYEMDGQIHEVGMIVVFKEVPTTEAEPAVPDTEYPMPPEEETETEPEIEFPEIDIDE